MSDIRLMELLKSDENARNWAVVLSSAVVGFFVTAILFPMWLDNIESAQVVAGLVQMPLDNAMRSYHLSIISFLIDSAALLLKIGFSDWSVCLFFSGLSGALFFSSLTACTLAFSRTASVALLVPFLLLRLQLNLFDLNAGLDGYWPKTYLQAFHGHSYPIFLPTHASIYGVMGLFLGLLIFGLFALEKRKTASFLAGFMLWIHATFALGCWIGLICAIYLGREYFRRDLRVMAKWFAAGALLALVGMGLHWVILQPHSEVTAQIYAPFLEAYQKNWDDHIVLTLKSVSAMLEVDVYTMLLLLATAVFLKDRMTAGMRFFARALFGVTGVVVLFMLWSLVAPGTVPFNLKVMMLPRWLNFNSMAYPVLVFGILGYLAIVRENLVALSFLFLNTLIFCTLTADSLTVSSHFDMIKMPNEGSGFGWGALFPCFGFGATCLLLASQSWLETRHWYGGWGESICRARLGKVIVSVLVLFVAIFYVFPRYNFNNMRGVDSWTPLMESLSKRKGQFVVYPGLWTRLQLRSRRSVLLDTTQVNMIKYVPETSPKVEHILNRVYGYTLAKPGMKYDYSFLLWTMRSMEDWQKIREEFGVTSVVAPRLVGIQLPIDYISSTYSVYYIPSLSESQAGNPLQIAAGI